MLLLLGSGISRPSGLPDVRTLTDRILEAKVKFVNPHFLEPQQGVEEMPGTEGVVPAVRGFLRLLKAYADRYYATRTGQEAHYEDIYYLVRQIIDDQLGEIDNPAVDSFIREVRAQAEPLSQKISAYRPEERYRGLAHYACNYISSVVIRELRTPDKIVGLDFLTEIAVDEDVKRLDLVTLNHDLLVENHLRAQGHQIMDGFTVPDGQILRFAPSSFDGNARIRLLKPHGSLNWHSYVDPNEGSYFAIPTNGDAEHARDEHEISLTWTGGPLMLAGTINKMIDYGHGIFAEQFFRLHQFLRMHDTVVVSGYSFNDKGVNSRLWDWFYEDMGRQLIVLHEDPEQLKMNARGSFNNAMSIFGDRIHFISQWMCDTNWVNDVKPYLRR